VAENWPKEVRLKKASSEQCSHGTIFLDNRITDYGSPDESRFFLRKRTKGADQ